MLFPRVVGNMLKNTKNIIFLQKKTETQPMVYASSLRAGAGEDPPEHRLLGHWQSLVGARDEGAGGWPMEPIIRER